MKRIWASGSLSARGRVTTAAAPDIAARRRPASRTRSSTPGRRSRMRSTTASRSSVVTSRIWMSASTNTRNPRSVGTRPALVWGCPR